MRKFIKGLGLGVLFFLGLYIFVVFLPTAFQGNVAVDPYIFKIGSYGLRWYGFLIAIGVTVAYLISERQLLRSGFKANEIEGTFLILVVLGLVGARIGFVIQDFNYFTVNPAEIMKIWDGGLSIHGALLGGILGLLISTKTYKYNFIKAANIIFPQIFLAGAIGRFGNFFNSEIIGQPTNLPWKMYVPVSNRPIAFENISYYHPVFLYEFVFFIVFYLVYILILKKFGSKFGFAYTVIFYSLTRVVVEFWRIDYHPILGPFDLAQLVSFGIIIIGLIVEVLTLIRSTVK